MKPCAGVLCVSPDDRVLLLQRSELGDAQGLWSIPGGHCKDEDESPKQCAHRELFEETAYRAGALGEPFMTRVEGEIHYTTFLFKCDEEFTPKLNHEHVAWGWFMPGEALRNAGVPPPAESPPKAPGEVGPYIR